MTTPIESRPSSALVAVFAVGYAVIVAELLDINRIPRAFVHRDYVVFEIVFVFVLWLCTLGALRLQEALGQSSAAASLGYGLVSGILGGLVATFGLLTLSIVTRRSESTVGYLSSWQGLADFAWAATVISFGWLIGIISGAARFLLSGKRTGLLIGFAAFCVIARIGLLALHLMHHQRLW